MTLRKEIEKTLLKDKYRDCVNDYLINELCCKVKKRIERIKLEFDVNVCECGEKWSETDCAILVNTLITELSGEIKGEK